MHRDEAIAVLRAHRTDLERFGIKSLALFGSVARDEAGPESDLTSCLSSRVRPLSTATWA